MVLEHFMVKKELTEAEIAESIARFMATINTATTRTAGTKLYDSEIQKERNDLLRR